MDFRAGGKERARFRFIEGTPLKGSRVQTTSVIRTSCPNHRVVLASTMPWVRGTSRRLWPRLSSCRRKPGAACYKRKRPGGTHLPHRNPPGFPWRSNGVPIAVRPGNAGWTGWGCAI